MFERFTDNARKVVVLSQEEARSLHYTSIDTDHELLALLANKEGAAEALLAEHGVTYQIVRDLCQTGPEPSPRGHIPFTTRSRKALQTAVHIAHKGEDGGQPRVTDLHLLLALFCTEGNLATEILEELDCDQQALCDALVKQLGMSTPFVAAEYQLPPITQSRQAVFDAIAQASEAQLRDALISAIKLMDAEELHAIEKLLSR